MNWQSIIQTPWGIVVFVSLVTVLVAAHELGHYLLARLFKMDCEEFAIGFGKKPLWTFMRRKQVFEEGEPTETAFTLRPWPLGGFVRIKGMNPEEDGSEVHVANGFYSKPPWQRFVVLFAGPVFSIAAGILTFTLLLSLMGVPMASDTSVLGNVQPESPAMKAGLRQGDHIVKLDGKPVKRWFDLVSYVRERPTIPIEVEFVRQGATQTVAVTPRPTERPEPIFDEHSKDTGVQKIQGRIGAEPTTVKRKLPFGEALVRSTLLPYMMAKGLVGVFLQPKRLETEVGGPIAIYAAAQASSKQGLTAVIELAAMLSISLGIFNLLPIPPLDGGQMLVSFIEMARRGRRLSFKLQIAIASLGFSLLMMLIAVVLVIDVRRFL